MEVGTFLDLSDEPDFIYIFYISRMFQNLSECLSVLMLIHNEIFN